MNRTLRDIMNNDLLFDGKIIMLGGDFRLFLSIKIYGTRSETVNLFDQVQFYLETFYKFLFNRKHASSSRGS